MGWLDLFRSAPAAAPVSVWTARAVRERELRVQARTEARTAPPEGSLDDLLLRVQGLRNAPWRMPSVREALGVPAIYRAVSLIAGSVGFLAVEAYRNGERLDAADTPMLVRRPNPLQTPRTFYRDTGYYLASRGEVWWNVANRDGDGNASALVVVPPWEVTVTQNDRDRLRPFIEWGGVRMPREDMRQITFMPDETAFGSYRGAGPLQICQAAISVAVESQEWAANYFASGGSPSVLIKAAGELDTDPVTGVSEADTLREQWIDKPNNVPRVIDAGIEDVSEFGVNVQGAQMLDARQHETGNAARMFGIPGSLLEYQQSGSSLTYQNLEGEFTKFVRACLAPNYLEPIEQEMSDLLTRSTTARFAVGGFERADAKTRAEIYNLLVPLGIISVEQAQRAEGIIPGDIEYAPVPPAPPAAIPAPIPARSEARTTDPLRCDGLRLLRGNIAKCGKLLAEDGHFVGRCPRCGKEYAPAAVA